jgi:hypothetical protein
MAIPASPVSVVESLKTSCHRLIWEVASRNHALGGSVTGLKVVTR